MERYEIPKEYQDCVKNIEEKTGKDLSTYLSQAILREITENTKTKNPTIYASKFIGELKGKSFFFIKEVTRFMLLDAEINTELRD